MLIKRVFLITDLPIVIVCYFWVILSSKIRKGEGVGNVLYAGKCCYFDRSLGETLSAFLKSKVLDYLYVREPCTDCHNHSRSPKAAVQYIVDTMRRNPTFGVIIHEPYLRDDILEELRKNLEKPICVTKEIMKYVEKKGIGADFKVQNVVRVLVTHVPYEPSMCKVENILRFSLMPCPMKSSTVETRYNLMKLKKERGCRVVLYRNHCSPLELENFVRDINAKHTVLLKPQERNEEFENWAHLEILKRLDGSDAGRDESKPLMVVGEEVKVDDEIKPKSSV